MCLLAFLAERQTILAQYVRSNRGTDLVYYEGNTYTPNEKLREGQKSRDWKCSMYHKAKCRARLVTRITSQDLSDDYLIVESVVNAHGKCYMSKCPKLRFIRGQRKSVQLVYKQYAYAKNKEHGTTIYWTCRIRRTGLPACNARLSTKRLTNENSIAIYTATSRGRMQLIYGGQPFIFEKTLKLSTGEEKRYWRCNQWWNQKCRSRVFTINDIVCPLNRFHTHEEIVRRKKRVRRVPPTDASVNANANANANTNTNAKMYTTTTTARQEQHQQQQQQQQQQQHHQHLHQQQQLASDAMLTTTLTDESSATIDVNELGMHLKYEEIVADVTGIVGATHSHTRVVTRKKSAVLFHQGPT